LEETDKFSWHNNFRDIVGDFLVYWLYEPCILTLWTDTTDFLENMCESWRNHWN
jgi:hypothetical protein